MSEEADTTDLLATFVDDQIEVERAALNEALDNDYDYASGAGCARALMALLATRARIADFQP